MNKIVIVLLCVIVYCLFFNNTKTTSIKEHMAAVDFKPAGRISRNEGMKYKAHCSNCTLMSKAASNIPSKDTYDVVVQPFNCGDNWHKIKKNINEPYSCPNDCRYDPETVIKINNMSHASQPLQTFTWIMPYNNVCDEWHTPDEKIKDIAKNDN